MGVIKNLIVFTALCLFPFAQSNAQMESNGFGTIHNDVFWNTTDGKPLYSHGGGIFRFTDPATGKKKYYWYGVRYKESEEYRKDPSVTLDKFIFDGVTCYTSENLVDWIYEGDVLTYDEIARHENVTWVGRLGVAYISEKKQYALVVQCGSEVLFATSYTPAGQFRWQHKKI